MLTRCAGVLVCCRSQAGSGAQGTAAGGWRQQEQAVAADCGRCVPTTCQVRLDPLLREVLASISKSAGALDWHLHGKNSRAFAAAVCSHCVEALCLLLTKLASAVGGQGHAGSLHDNAIRINPSTCRFWMSAYLPYIFVFNLARRGGACPCGHRH